MGLAEISRFDHPVLQNYLVDDAFDETFESSGKPGPYYAPLLETFSSLPADEIRRRKHAADLAFLNQGISRFTGETKEPSGSSLTISCLASSPALSGTESSAA
jgi:uncharacterized circularly permuted ATP-grasp superfamily protein